MRISVHGGHNSIVQGANSGSRKEHVMDRAVKDALISKLRALGHTVYDDTDETGSTQNANLNNIVAKCNSHAVDLVISVHLNAYNGSAHGVEVLYYDQSALASKVSAQLSKDIGWYNRGAKQRTDLAVLARTNAPAILLELGFIDNDSDMAKWNVDKIANSVIYAVTGQTAGSSGGSTPSQPSGYRHFTTGGFMSNDLVKMHTWFMSTKAHFTPYRSESDGAIYFWTGDYAVGTDHYNSFKKFMADNGYWYKEETR